MQHGMDEAHRRPDGLDDTTVEAVGKVTEAFEWIERARGRLYDFHQMIGHADLVLGEAADMLRRCGHHEEADAVERDVVGRNVIDGRWTFQVVEEFDQLYYDKARAAEKAVRDRLTAGRRHVFEAEFKERRRTHGQPGHEFRPLSAHDSAIATMNGSER